MLPLFMYAILVQVLQLMINYIIEHRVTAGAYPEDIWQSAAALCVLQKREEIRLEAANKNE